MTSDEIKEMITMSDVLAMYGLKPNRRGFICCPFHKEKTPSLKIYKDSFHCFGCGESGDIFSFVQKYQNVDFKEAFVLLGGEYEHDEAIRKQIKYKKKEIEYQKQTSADYEKIRRVLAESMTYCDEQIQKSEPFSDEWCYMQNIKPVLVYYWEYYIIDRNEVTPDDKSGILEKCNQLFEFKQRT